MNLLEAWEGLVWLGAFLAICSPFYFLWEWGRDRGASKQSDDDYEQWLHGREAKWSRWR